MDEKRIKKLMKTLEISREEAIEIIEEDKEIDRGAKLYELTDEQKKVEKKMKNTGTRKSHAETGVYNWNKTPKQRDDEQKEAIIKEILNFLQKNENISTENCEITNKTRQIAFAVGADSFELTLVRKNPNKKSKKGA